MPVGADVRKALRRGSDVGAMLGVGAEKKLWKKKRAEGGRKRDDRHGRERGDVTLHAAQRGGRACHVIGPSCLRAAGAGGHAKPPVSTQRSGCHLSPKTPPARLRLSAEV